MIKVCIIGYGNVGQQLYKAFKKSKKVTVLQVYGRSVEPKIKGKTQFINDFTQLLHADTYFLTVRDNAIEEVAKLLPENGTLLVHTSGSMPLDTIAGRKHRGVFYPLQTISQEVASDFNKIPICLEAENTQDAKLLKKLAKSISKKVVFLSSGERQKLHLAAVWVNNFSNHLFHLAYDYLTENQLDFQLLMPLILETTEKLKSVTPFEAQTGPARRHDTQTLQKHLALLEDPKQKEIYTLLSNSIQEKFN